MVESAGLHPARGALVYVQVVPPLDGGPDFVDGAARRRAGALNGASVVADAGLDRRLGTTTVTDVLPVRLGDGDLDRAGWTNGCPPGAAS